MPCGVGNQQPNLNLPKLMPCRSDYMDDGSSSVRAELDRVTRLLCTLCGTVIAHGYEKEIITNNPELNVWWIQHQEADRKRLAQEAEDRRKAALKASTLASLTDEQKQLLGIRE